MYIFGADGTPYAFANDHGPEDIEELMNLGLDRFKAAPPKPVAITEDEKNSAFSITPPAAAQVLQVYARIPSPPENVSYLNKGVGRDFCWIYESERNEVSGLASRGEPFDFPGAISRRIARFHLVDSVRGTPNMWSHDEVKSLSLRATPAASGELRLKGSFKLRSSGGKRGYEGVIEGTLRFDPETLEWSHVRILADGTAFGAGTYTPNQPPKPYRLLVGLLNSDLPESQIVPPEEVATRNNDTRYREP